MDNGSEVEVLNADSVTSVEDGPSANDNGAVSTGQSFINGTNMMVYVRLRSGILLPISPSRNETGFFTVRVSLSMPTRTCQAVYEQSLVTTNANFANPEREIYQKALRAALEKSAGTIHGLYRVDTSLDYNLSIQTLRQHGTIYLRDLDFIVSVGIPEQVPYHPNSHDTAYSAVSKLLENDMKLGLEFSFVHVTNKSTDVKPLYYLFAGKPCKLKPIYIQDALPGFYYYTGKVKNIQDYVGINSDQHIVELSGIDQDEMKYFPSVDGLLKLGFVFYDDRLKAEQAKDRRMDHEIELMERKAKLQETEMAYKQKFLEMEANLENVKKEKALLEHRLSEEKDRMDFKITTMKHHLDAKSIERKDSSETIRWIPAIITGLGAILGAFKIFK